MTVTWQDAVARRLARHHLSEPAAAGDAPGEVIPGVVRAICGAHAQVMVAAETSIGVRVHGVTRSDVRRALHEDRTLVKTYGPRGTVHLLPGADLGDWVGAMTWIGTQGPGMPPGVRLAGEELDAVVAALGAALAGEELTVEELDEVVPARVGAWAGDLVMPAFAVMWPRWRQALGVSAHRGALCFGRPRGRKVTYTNPATWLTGYAPADGPAAARRLAVRYLRAYGPATGEDFARWLGVRPGRAAEVLAGAGEAFERVRFEGSDAWQMAGDADGTPAPAGRSVRLLPLFDAYVVGSRPRHLVYPGRARERALAGGQAGNYPVVLVDGVVTGVWHQRLAARRVFLTVELFGSSSARLRREVEEQAERVASVLQVRAEVAFGETGVGPHA